MHYRGRERRKAGIRRATRVIGIINAQIRSYPLGIDALRRMAKTRVPCSCPGCSGNRKFYGPTIQERRATVLEIAHLANQLG
jgi:hypothetical protein